MNCGFFSVETMPLLLSDLATARVKRFGIQKLRNKVNGTGTP